METNVFARMTPLSKQPLLIKFWIRQSDVTLLVISIIAYVVGLAVYVIKSQVGTCIRYISWEVKLNCAFQHSVVSIVTCVGTTCCAVGIGIVWGHHFYENIYRRWKKSPTVDSSLTEDTQSSEDYQSNFHWWGKGPTVDSSLDKTTQSPENDSEGIFRHVVVMMSQRSHSEC